MIQPVARPNGELLTRFPKTICAMIDVELPELKKCEPISGPVDLKELKKQGVIDPAVLVSVLGAKSGQTYAGGAHSFTLNMAAYVVTRDGMGPNANRDIRAANICGALLGLIPGKNWSEAALGSATAVAMHTLISAQTRDVTMSLWAVTWEQPITFFKREDGPLGAELYVALAPKTGAENEDDYEAVGGES